MAFVRGLTSSVSSLASFGSFLIRDIVRIVLGSPAREIIMDDVSRYLAFDARVSFVWRPFFGVIEGANPNHASAKAAGSTGLGHLSSTQLDAGGDETHLLSNPLVFRHIRGYGIS